jgi:hypothetical protein
VFERQPKKLAALFKSLPQNHLCGARCVDDPASALFAPPPRGFGAILAATVGQCRDTTAISLRRAVRSSMEAE